MQYTEDNNITTNSSYFKFDGNKLIRFLSSQMIRNRKYHCFAIESIRIICNNMVHKTTTVQQGVQK